MEKSKKVKRVYVCPTCKGNGYVKVACIMEKDDMIHQCWDCDSQGEIYDYDEVGDFNINSPSYSVH
tara:strand:- start:356 stop:553 length:198 start_codon:yes stop_codon:yes gene_type:complete